mmetsp:Transcript_3195/g.8805  ORF Transcript_3195/g.8805 Transcript_3195/m.8805 type:complete len:254 (+) Transcript_3195:487-1248(+)
MPRSRGGGSFCSGGNVWLLPSVNRYVHSKSLKVRTYCSTASRPGQLEPHLGLGSPHEASPEPLVSNEVTSTSLMVTLKYAVFSQSAQLPSASRTGFAQTKNSTNGIGSSRMRLDISSGDALSTGLETTKGLCWRLPVARPVDAASVEMPQVKLHSPSTCARVRADRGRARSGQDPSSRRTRACDRARIKHARNEHSISMRRFDFFGLAGPNEQRFCSKNSSKWPAARLGPGCGQPADLAARPSRHAKPVPSPT